MINDLVNRFINKIKKILATDTSYLLLLMVISFLSYGLLGAWLNFFHDEIPILWFHKKMGDVGIFFEGNRPFLEWVYRPLLVILGTNSWGWIIFSVLSRWLHAACFYLLLKEIWPNNHSLWKVAGLLILVYPGFQVQFASMIFSITFLLFTSLIISFLLTLKTISATHQAVHLIIISLVLSALSLFTSEYFFFLELIRYPLIWIFIRNQALHKPRKNFLLFSCPFLILFLGAVLWRLHIQSLETTYTIQIFDQLSTSFTPALSALLSTAFSDLFTTVIGVWIKAFYPARLLQEQGVRIIIVYAIVSFFIFLLTTIFLASQTKKSGVENQITYPIPSLLSGFFALVLGGVPFWVAGLPVGQEFFFSRWTIPFMFGACITLPILLNVIIRKKIPGIILFSLIIALGFGVQFLSANSFRHDFQRQNRFYWQMIWRIPQIKRDTLFLSDMLDFRYENSDHVSMGINFALSSKPIERDIPLFLYYVPERLGTSILPDIQRDMPISAKRYYSSFESSTSESLVIDFQDPACLKILDPEIDQYNPNISEMIKETLMLANLDRIQFSEPAQISPVAVQVIGKEPRRDWCYLFQKADLYRQFNMWPEVQTLYLEAEDRQLEPRDGREWFPFIEGFAHLEEWELSLNISRAALEKTGNISPPLCALWERIFLKTGHSPDSVQYQDLIRSELNCH